MNGVVNKIGNFTKKEQTVTWIKLISITGGAQVIVQLVGLISGIIVIRMLPTHEYGLYTLANTMLGTMLVLADGGISSGVMSQGGKVWQDREKLGIVLATGMDLRMKFAIASLLIAIPFLLYLLVHHDASWLVSFLIVLSLIPSFFTSLSGSLLQVAPKLNQDIGPLQKNNIISNTLRLILIMITLFVFPWSSVAIFVAGISQLWANANLKKISFGYANWKQKPDAAVRKEILFFVKRILPGSIYYCLSGQITIWLISFFGNTAAVAQVGALGRLGMMLGIFTAILNTLIVPRFSRLPNEKRKLFKTFFLIQLGLIALGLLIIGIVYLFPSQILWILGKDYSNLKTELILSIAGSCLGLVAGSAFGLSTSRGWAINPLISIPLTLVAIIAGILMIDISTLAGVLKFNLFVYFVEILMYYLYCTIKISKTKLAFSL
jgi:O-antigen/teichoic acid export membrane protein